MAKAVARDETQTVRIRKKRKPLSIEDGGFRFLNIWINSVGYNM